MTEKSANHGTLTAEQVRKSIESRFDFDVWVPKERWQAIADELNAKLGSGTITAEQVSVHLKAMAYDLQSPNPFKSLEEKQEIIEKYANEIAELGSEICDAVRDERTQTIVCSKCGGGGLTIPNKGQKAMRNFCPNCGARIRKAVER
jgi:DNA-directed RNA polymerase subunit RPC12/RpoP